MACYSYLKHCFKVRVTLAGVSYSITVESIGGTHSVAVSGEVPEGKHVISGHEDASNATLSVSRARQDGVYIASASFSYIKEQ